MRSEFQIFPKMENGKNSENSEMRFGIYNFGNGFQKFGVLDLKFLSTLRNKFHIFKNEK